MKKRTFIAIGASALLITSGTLIIPKMAEAQNDKKTTQVPTISPKEKTLKKILSEFPDLKSFQTALQITDINFTEIPPITDESIFQPDLSGKDDDRDYWTQAKGPAQDQYIKSKNGQTLVAKADEAVTYGEIKKAYADHPDNRSNKEDEAFVNSQSTLNRILREYPTYEKFKASFPPNIYKDTSILQPEIGNAGAGGGNATGGWFGSSEKYHPVSDQYTIDPRNGKMELVAKAEDAIRYKDIQAAYEKLNK